MTPEKRETAIKWLTEEIRSLRLAPKINSCGPENWKDQLEIMETCLEAVRDHFHDTTKMVSLTEEQLKMKIGDPVFIRSERRSEWMILWGYHPPEVYGRSFIFTRRTAQKEQFQFSELGATWNAYAYPPAHIDREAWEPCDFCRGDKEKYGLKYCQNCGRPLTEEAWAELEKRLRG